MMRFLCVVYCILALGTHKATAQDPVSIPIVDALKETCGRTTLKGDPLTIVGGELAGEGEFPWIVSFQRIRKNGSNSHYCGGSILSENWILSAAHCFTDYANGSWDIKDASIVVGTNNHKDGSGHRYHLEKIIVHEKYNAKEFPDDIALVRTKEKINFQKTDTNYKVNSVCLPPYKSDSESYPPKTAVVAGWGVTKAGNKVLPSELLKVKLDLVDHQVCTSKYSDGEVSLKTVCYAQSSKGSCQGDSGGPVQKLVGAQSHQIGLVSFGHKDCGEEPSGEIHPSVFTEVNAYRDWIRDHIH